MADEVNEPVGELATRAALARSLGSQREHVLGALDGLTDRQLREPVLPSGWSCVGLVNHLALDVERYWFTCIMGGAPLEPDDPGADDRAGAWRVEDDVAPADVIARYRREIEAADRVIAAIGLDEPPRQRDEWWGSWAPSDLRFVLLHVIAETACHAGHLDAARELLDGKQWLVL